MFEDYFNRVRALRNQGIGALGSACPPWDQRCQQRQMTPDMMGMALGGSPMNPQGFISANAQYDPNSQQGMLQAQMLDADPDMSFGQEGIDMTNEALASNNMGMMQGLAGIGKMLGGMGAGEQQRQPQQLMSAQSYTTPYQPMSMSPCVPGSTDPMCNIFGQPSNLFGV